MAAAPITISCDECVLERTTACEDCVVSFLLDHEQGSPVVIDAEEVRAVRLLHSAGLVPALRHRRRAS